MFHRENLQRSIVVSLKDNKFNARKITRHCIDSQTHRRRHVLAERENRFLNCESISRK